MAGAIEILVFGAFVVCIVCAVWVVDLVLKQRAKRQEHEERMAMIEAGIHPDQPGELPAGTKPGGLSETLDHESSRQPRRSG